jgi:hypothetical protein
MLHSVMQCRQHRESRDALEHIHPVRKILVAAVDGVPEDARRYLSKGLGQCNCHFTVTSALVELH